jgi:hypothetical protein
MEVPGPEGQAGDDLSVTTEADVTRLIEEGLVAREEILQLRTENGTLRRRLENRESALAGLNRRLLAVERAQFGEGHDESPSGHHQGQSVEELRLRIAELEAHLSTMESERDRAADELARVYATKVFRYAAPARKVYGRFRNS